MLHSTNIKLKNISHRLMNTIIDKTCVYIDSIIIVAMGNEMQKCY